MSSLSQGTSGADLLMDASSHPAEAALKPLTSQSSSALQLPYCLETFNKTCKQLSRDLVQPLFLGDFLGECECRGQEKLTGSFLLGLEE